MNVIHYRNTATGLLVLVLSGCQSPQHVSEPMVNEAEPLAQSLSQPSQVKVQASEPVPMDVPVTSPFIEASVVPESELFGNEFEQCVARLNVIKLYDKTRHTKYNKQLQQQVSAVQRYHSQRFALAPPTVQFMDYQWRLVLTSLCDKIQADLNALQIRQISTF